MQNSDLVFNLLTAAAAFGAAIVLAPSAARTDAPARLYADGSAEPAEIHSRAALFAASEESKNVRKTTGEGNAQLQSIGNPTPARKGPKARRP